MNASTTETRIFTLDGQYEILTFRSLPTHDVITLLDVRGLSTAWIDQVVRRFDGAILQLTKPVLSREDWIELGKLFRWKMPTEGGE